MILILDLDDTIYETATIGHEIITVALSEININEAVISKILKDFGKVSTFEIFYKHNISATQIILFYQALVLQKAKLSIETFSDYQFLQEIQCDKYLVTTGYKDWQLAKIEHLGISQDFIEIMVHIPGNRYNKAYFFKEIQKQTGLPFSEHYVIGDNPHNELNHGHELGMKTIQRRTSRQIEFLHADYFIDGFEELESILDVGSN